MKKYALGIVLLMLSSFVFAGFPTLTGPATNTTGSFELSGNEPEDPFFLHDVWKRAPGKAWKELDVGYEDYPVDDVVSTSGVYAYRTRWYNPNTTPMYSEWSNTIYVNVSLSGPPTDAPFLRTPYNDDIDGTYTVSWGAVAGATAYRLQESTDGVSFYDKYYGSADKRIITQPNGSYKYRVKGCNSEGCGPYSAARTVVVSIPPGTIPGRPEELITVPSVPVVYWSTVVAASYYELERSMSRFSTHPFTNYYTGSGDFVYLAGTPYGDYNFRVRACNSSGCSAWRNSF